MRRRRPRLAFDEEGMQAPWPSFADVTATVALIFFVLVLLSYVRNLISGNQLNLFQAKIVAAERRLSALEQELQATAVEIEAGRDRLAQSQLSIQAQRDVLAYNTRELATLRGRLSGIALLRVEVLNKVKRAIEWEVGSLSSLGAPLVTIGDNGNIVINEGLVFEFNSYAIKAEGALLLDTLAQALGHVLRDADVRANVDAIMIQGHTDERGSGAFNRALSARRANAVLDYLFEANPALESTFGSYFASSAFSEFRPLDEETNEQAYERNRRIEISVVLKDSNVRRVIDQYTQPLPRSDRDPLAAPATASAGPPQSQHAPDAGP